MTEELASNLFSSELGEEEKKAKLFQPEALHLKLHALWAIIITGDSPKDSALVTEQSMPHIDYSRR